MKKLLIEERGRPVSNYQLSDGPNLNFNFHEDIIESSMNMAELHMCVFNNN